MAEMFLDFGGQYVTVQVPPSPRFYLHVKLAQVHMATPGLFNAPQLTKLISLLQEARAVITSKDMQHEP